MIKLMNRDVERRILVLFSIFTIALILRIALMVALPDMGSDDRLDSALYTGIAHNLIHGNGFSINGSEPTMFVGPLYPGVIAGLYLLFGENDLSVKLFQALLGAFTVLLIFWTADLILGTRTAVVAALLVAVHPELIAISSFLYTETLFTTLLVAGMLVTLLAITRQSWGLFACAGFVLGLGALCRGVLLPFPVFILLGLLAARIPWRNALIWTVILVLAMVLVVSPWALRNYRLSHQVVPVSDGFGITFWQGNYQPFDGRYRYEESLQRMAEIAGNTFGPEREALLVQATLEQMREYPTAALWLIIRKAGRLWLEVYENVPSGAKRTADQSIMWALGVWHYLMLVLGVIGLVLYRRADVRFNGIYALLIFLTVVHAITLSVPRYRLPIMPYICIFAACGLLAVCGRTALLKICGLKKDRIK